MDGILCIVVAFDIFGVFGVSSAIVFFNISVFVL